MAAFPRTRSVRAALYSASAWLAAAPLGAFLAGSDATATAAEATLVRDTWGVPHAIGDTEPAAFFALGYAQAEDRLADIYTAIRTATGRLAEVEGESVLEQDYLMRLTGNDTIHKAYLETAPAHLRANVAAFTDGIKAYIAEHPDEAADIAVDVEPWHPLAVGRAMILRWPIGTIMGDLNNREERARPAAGSNQWAVSPARSADGSAILLSDPHLTWEGLAVLYEARVHAGDLHACGYYLIGSPMLAIGHNAKVGWALTTGGPDTSDVYRMKFKLNPLPVYEYDGEWRPVEMKVFQIRVKDRGVVTKPAFFTHLGPVISEPDMEAGVAYVGASPYMDQTGLYDQFDRMNRATSVFELNDALALHQYNEQNVMSADVHGNISYVRNGATPVRPEGHDWSRPVDGTTSATAWKGIHPQEDLVKIVNPSQGYMQNCNISPANMMVDSPLTPDKYPEYIYNVSWDSNNPRGQRTVELLANNDAVTVEDAVSYTLDIHDGLAERWQAELRGAIAEADPPVAADSVTRQAADAILAWDGEYTPEQTATVLLKFWRLACGNELDLTPLGQGEPLPSDTRKQLLKLFDRTISELSERYGRWDVPWGEVHVVGRGGVYFPCGGADYQSGNKEANFSETLFDVRSTEDKQQPGRYIANSGSMAMILMFFDGNGVRSMTCTPWGQSGHADSPHYVDQAEGLYAKRQMKPTWSSQDDLAEHTESTRRFRYPAAPADQ
ncbi:MAG: penicillin acylase family protein [Pirellulales bacterium]